MSKTKGTIIFTIHTLLNDQFGTRTRAETSSSAPVEKGILTRTATRENTLEPTALESSQNFGKSFSLNRNAKPKKNIDNIFISAIVQAENFIDNIKYNIKIAINVPIPIRNIEIENLKPIIFMSQNNQMLLKTLKLKNFIKQIMLKIL